MANSYELTVPTSLSVQRLGRVIEQVAHAMQRAYRGIRLRSIGATQVTLVFPWTWRSFGETLTIAVQGESNILIRSRCRVFTTLVDWGKNRLNVDWAAAHLQTALADETGEASQPVRCPPWTPEFRPISAMIFGLTIGAAFFAQICVTTPQRLYPFAMPFFFMAALCCLTGVLAVARSNRWTSLLQNLVLAPTVVLYVLAVSHWPGGDDGRGMILVGMVGPLLLMAVILATFSTVRLLREERSR